MHVAYASRQAAYPPPIVDISSNTAVARAVAARETLTGVALRAGDVPVALRTTLDDAARPTVACAAESDTFTVPPRDETFVLVALRADKDEPAFETFAAAPRPTTVVVERRVAARDALAPDVAFVWTAPRRTSRPSFRAVAVTF